MKSFFFQSILFLSAFLSCWNCYGIDSIPSVEGKTLSKESIPSLNELIQCVKGNEVLYHNVRFHYRCRMSLEKSFQFRGFERLLDHFLFDIDFVRVGQSFISRKNRDFVTVKGKAGNYKEEIRSDGQSFFLIDGSSVVNIVDDPPNQTDYLHPHALLGNEKFSMNYPLSDLLAGGEAVLSYPTINRFDCQTKIIGLDRILGEPCVKVVVEIKQKRKGGTKVEYRNIWLTISKNYFPVRIVSYNTESQDSITCEAQVDRFEEIDHGIWFPIKMTSKGYDEHAKKVNGAFPLMDVFTAEVTNIMLNPSVKVESFRERIIPDGYQVLHIKNKKVLSSYVKGIAKTNSIRSNSKRSSRYWLYAILFGSSVLALVVSIVLYRRFQRISVRFGS